MEGPHADPGKENSPLVSSEIIPATFGSSKYKCKRPACDINAIGHRNLVSIPSVGDWYSLQKEKQLGDKYSAELEQRVEIVRDDEVTRYVEGVAQHIVQNSDADMPITIRIVRTSDADAYTLAGGHLYITTALVLRLRSEGELASVLARGIAHTALHSVMRLQSRTNLMKVASLPTVGPDSLPVAVGGNNSSLGLGLLKFRRDFELQADYFGIQYVYKSGYDTDCFLSALQTLWQPDPRKPMAKAFSPFPPLAERLKPLQKEIKDILPKRPGDIVSTSAFDSFMERLRQVALPEPPSEKDARPKLIRHDPAVSN